jgi:hypothetical protein
VTGRGHFEVFPVRHEAPAVAGIIGEPTGRYRWRFLDDAGRERMVSTREFRDEGKAKADAGELVTSIRAATYGQRFVQEIADAVRVVDV